MMLPGYDQWLIDQEEKFEGWKDDSEDVDDEN
ncbi:hypothetical protein MUDAN_BIHEEGNE_02260 [Lactiplantibacillus mudanjiangensis]|nr:hypothetical protein MUDAN_BIHEEGNE_02260 [Lactiplantibacillus mudanjiangensis]